MKSSILTLATVAALSSATTFAEEITVSANITTDTTWTSDNTYVLDGQIFVTEDAILTIEPGTVIYGAETDPASALVITVGSQIMAEGTASQPIIMTSILAQSGDLTADDTALWGGLVVLGDAVINSRADKGAVGDPAQDQIEGFSGAGITELITFGGTDDADNSGVIKYLSLRHAGSVIGGDNEINGLTLGGVGSGTTIEYVEVFANKDDAIEFFGGTVSVKYFVNAFGYDDGVDYDQGWRGNMQYVFQIQRVNDDTSVDDKGDKGGEHDGSTSPADATPLGGGKIANATYIGLGAEGDNTALNIRDNAGAEYYNSIFTDYELLTKIESDNQTAVDADRLVFDGNIWFSKVSANNTLTGIQDLSDDNIDISSVITAGSNDIVDPELVAISRETDGTLDPRPADGSPAAYGAVAVPSDSFFEQTGFRGAFSPDSLWIKGWTALDEYGYLADVASSDAETVLVALSGRFTVEAGEGETIVGLILEDAATLAIAAKGESIAESVSNPLADPEITVVQLVDDAFVEVTTGIDESATFPSDIAPLESATNDEAIVISLSAGVYGIRVSSGDGTAGIALVEAYDVTYFND
ncbi:MAG: T9SS C-terminal target domain-containing protein [Opitutales bacterium]